MLYVVQQFINSLTHFLLREDYFPLTQTLSPIGGEGKKLNRFNALWLVNPATSPTPSPPASGGEGWGEGGQNNRMQFPNRTVLPYGWTFTVKPAATKNIFLIATQYKTLKTEQQPRVADRGA